ncbi:hypothetical protein CHGG_05939 [Chaetomium globosum CBS 148.51]|uniref:Uncharacterized protein n=1 Tax=Chaetomium globosum (strain ATCC 6205 / CBS 148.51 / DSM 1962 / NBRC 6347 / NRRL 1970) TaxID=306901 RepID=Q2H5X6_CHAGB|nr:uncharacterized protein CHGG_05939 [Chaetomium globosum CBS 148.51]EAQ89320.1 hypothetical protein CHGG_05939 [Chaetomium globosum CBS 148.51]
MLRKHFRPTPVRTIPSVSSKEKPSANVKREYHLALKVIYTDATSLPLIDFIKETLAPNSLEDLSLLHRRSPMGSLLSMNAIFKGAIKPHHKSLRNVLLNAYGLGWALPTKMSLYLTSGRMKNLAALFVTMKFKDWMLSHPTINITALSELDFANQILDVVSLRPEVGLRYLGIGLSCFEILEAPATPLAGRGAGSRATESSPASSFDDSDEEESSNEEFDDEEDGQHPVFVNAANSWEGEDDEDAETDIDDDDNDEDYEDDDEDDDEDDGFVEPGSESVKFELRKVDFCRVDTDIIN